MSDDNDPTGERISDGFDRLGRDSQNLDTADPLRGLRDRRGLPWARIALGGGAVAAILVIVGIFGFGDDDEPEEILAGGAAIEDQLGLPEGWLQDTRWDLLGGIINETNVLVVEPPNELAAASPGTEVDVIVVQRRQSVTFSGTALTAVGYCGGFESSVEVEGGELVVSDTSPVGASCEGGGEVTPEIARFITALRATASIQVMPDLRRITLVGPDSVFTYEAATPRALTETVTDIDALTDTVADLDDRVAGQLPPGLDDTRWTLVDGGTELPLLEEWRPLRLTFVDGRFIAWGYCTALAGQPSGSSLFSNETVEEQEVARSCPQEMVGTDMVYLGAMRSVSGGRMQGGDLQLHAAAGDLVFSPEPTIDLDALTGVRWELDAWDLGLDGSGRLPDGPGWFEMRPSHQPDAAQPSGIARGTTGCLEFSGLWHVVENRILFTVRSDFDSCPDRVSDQDAQVSYAFGSAVVPVFDEDVVTMFATRDVEASRFRRSAPIEISNQPLEGTTWQLVSSGSPQPVPGGITIVFDSERFSGRGPCGDYGDDYALDGESFATGDIPQTLGACQDDVLEADYLRTLRQADRLRMDMGLLIISSGATDLLFEPLPVQGVTGPLEALVGTELDLTSWSLRNNTFEATTGISLVLLPGSTFRITTPCATIDGFYARITISVSPDVTYLATRSSTTSRDCNDNSGQEPDSQVIEDLLVGVPVRVVDDHVIFGEPEIQGLTFGP